MTKEQFIKELEHIAESGSNEIRLGNLFDIVIAKDRESRWISVKDSYPEPNELVLISFSYPSGREEKSISFVTSDHPNIFDHVFYELITHWQQLPEPPKL